MVPLSGEVLIGLLKKKEGKEETHTHVTDDGLSIMIYDYAYHDMLLCGEMFA